MKSFKFIKKYLNKIKYNYILLIIFSSVLAAINIFVPVISGIFLDSLLSIPNKHTIMYLTLVYLLIAILQIALSYNLSLISTKIRLQLSFSIIDNIITHLQNCSLKILESINSAYIIHRIQNDCNSIINFFLTVSTGIVTNFIVLLFSIYFIIKNAPFIAAIVVVLFIVYVIIFLILKPKIESCNQKVKDKSAIYTYILESQFINSLFIRVFELYTVYNKKIKENFDCLKNLNIKNTKLNFIFQSSDSIINLILQISLFAYGGIKIINGEISIGIFTVLSSYISHLISSTKFFLNIGPLGLESNLSVDRLSSYFDINEISNGSVQLEKINCIELNDVTFGYNTNSIINKFTKKFEIGKVYQIHGENGSGKTTLLSLIMGLYHEDYLGSIRINGIDIMDLDMRQVRKSCFGVVLQKDIFFDESFDNNLLVNTNDSQKLLIDYLEKYNLKKLNLHNNRKNEYFNFSNLSGGESKKLNLIRALIKTNASVVLLDEPLVSLDEDSIKIFMDDIYSIKNDKIIILASHNHNFNSIVDEHIFL